MDCVTLVTCDKWDRSPRIYPNFIFNFLQICCVGTTRAELNACFNVSIQSQIPSTVKVKLYCNLQYRCNIRLQHFKSPLYSITNYHGTLTNSHSEAKIFVGSLAVRNQDCDVWSSGHPPSTTNLWIRNGCSLQINATKHAMQPRTCRL